MKALDRELDRIHRGVCSECGWEAAWDEFEEVEGYGTLCEECWEVLASEDPTVYFERF